MHKAKDLTKINWKIQKLKIKYKLKEINKYLETTKISVILLLAITYKNG